MRTVKFNKRVNCFTPVVRCVLSGRGLQYALMRDPRQGFEHELLVKFPSVLFQYPPFQSLNGVSWGKMKDWLKSKAN